MPCVLACPTCHHPLTVHEAQAGSVVACPTCRHPLTVPALASAPVPSATPFDTGTDQPLGGGYRRRHRRAERGNGWVVGCVACAVAAVAVLAVAAAVYWQWREGRDEQEAETANHLVILNRQSSVLQQMSFWRDREALIALPLSMELEEKALAELSDTGENALNKKYGHGRAGLTTLNRRRGEAFDALREATKAATRRHVEEAYRAALAELARTPDRRAEVLPRWAKHAHDQIEDDVQKLEKTFWKVR